MFGLGRVKLALLRGDARDSPSHARSSFPFGNLEVPRRAGYRIVSRTESLHHRVTVQAAILSEKRGIW